MTFAIEGNIYNILLRVDLLYHSFCSGTTLEDGHEDNAHPLQLLHPVFPEAVFFTERYTITKVITTISPPKIQLIINNPPIWSKHKKYD